MGPFKFLGTLFNSATESIDLLDRGVQHAKRVQTIEHAKELRDLLKDEDIDALAAEVATFQEKTDKLQNAISKLS